MEGSTESNPAGLPFLVLSVIHFAVATALFTRQRRVFPLCGHSFGLVIMMSCTLLLFAVNVSLELFLGFVPCAQVILMIYPLFFLWASITLARSWRAWFFYNYAGDKMRCASTSELYDRYSWFSRKKHHFSDAHLMVYAFLAMVFFQLVAGVPWLVTVTDITMMVDEEIQGLEKGCNALYTKVVMQVFMSLVVLLHMVTVFKLRRVKDGYHLRRDGFVSAATFLMLFIAGITMRATGLRITAMCLININLFAMVTWKALMSYRNLVDQYRKVQQSRKLRKKKSRARKLASARSEDQLSISSVSMVVGNLKEVINDEELMSEFNEHLRSEFSIENMLFYKRAKQFTEQCMSEDSTWSTEDRNREAASIYSEFIARDGELQVNLPSHIYSAILVELKEALVGFNITQFRRKKVVKSARPVASTIFEAASGSVYVLMGSDTFVRFKMKLLRRSSMSRSPNSAAGDAPFTPSHSTSPLKRQSTFNPQTPTHVARFNQPAQSVSSSEPPPPPPDDDGVAPPPPPSPSVGFGGVPMSV